MVAEAEEEARQLPRRPGEDVVSLVRFLIVRRSDRNRSAGCYRESLRCVCVSWLGGSQSPLCVVCPHIDE